MVPVTPGKMGEVGAAWVYLGPVIACHHRFGYHVGMARPRSLNPLVHLGSRVTPQVKAALEEHASEHECTVGAVIERMCRQAGILQVPPIGPLSVPDTVRVEADGTIHGHLGGNYQAVTGQTYTTATLTPLLTRAFANEGGQNTAVFPQPTNQGAPNFATERRARVERARAAQAAMERTLLTPQQVRDTLGRPLTSHNAPLFRQEYEALPWSDPDSDPLGDIRRHAELAPDLHQRVQNRAISFNHQGTPHQWNLNGQCALCGIIDLAHTELVAAHDCLYDTNNECTICGHPPF